MRYAPEASKLLDLWIKQSRALHWWFPYDGLVLLSERHSTLHVDSQGRMHCEEGPACAYPDGWGVWSWHGVVVPQQVIEQPDTLTVEAITGEENAEVRRVMLERFGAERFVREAGGDVIHEADLKGRFPEYVSLGAGRREFVGYAPGAEHVRLIRTKLLRADNKPLTFVHVTCPSTAREYYLRVNPNHTDAIEAVASTFQMSGAEYLSMVEVHS